MDKSWSVGIDVSQKWLDVCRSDSGEKPETCRFANTAQGHLELVRWLRGRKARVVVESTGRYSTDLVLALWKAPEVEVMVANPHRVKEFRGAFFQRARTDRTSAEILAEYAVRMPFVPWNPPSRRALELRELMRRVEALTEMATQEKNRLHAELASREHSRVVCEDLRRHVHHLQGRIRALRRQALKLVEQDPILKRAYHHLCSVRGIASLTALKLLGELLVLPEGLGVRQWVAHAGLDPRPVQSGSSVDRPVHISRMGNVHLRRALFLPALVAMRHDPHVRAFAEHLRSRGKKPMVVVVAVMRKLLHAIYGMLRTDTDFIGEKFFRMTTLAAA
ncbi:MAG: IS110 family transposase [Candidatus Binatia bacterium]|nr:MAG: IS110 family transposase [Candidatus Binatia bacterium]GIW42005.1 MAG: IS110 family transposase [Candidatus Binatia bacterium]